jgi:energy-coupling factor transporter ATP-binding protein EcfA2
MRRMDDRVVLHAASLEIGGVGLALLGEKGSGKSTLALLGAKAGHRFFGDEILPLEPKSLAAFAFPKAVTLKQGAFHLFEEEAEHRDPVRGTVRYHLPEHHARPDDRIPISGLVFPTFASDAESARLVPLRAEEVTLPLVQQVFGGLERNRSSLRCIARLAEMPRFHLSFSDGAAALGRLEALSTELKA